MKRFLALALLLSLLLAGACRAEELQDEEAAVPTLMISGGGDSELAYETLPVSSLERDGMYTMFTGYIGDMRFYIEGAAPGEVYRLRLSGTADNGAPIEYYTHVMAATQENVSYLPVVFRDLSPNEGVHGPYVLELSAKGLYQRYDIRIKVPSADLDEYEMHDEYMEGILENGGGEPMQFADLASDSASEQRDETLPLQIITPMDGAVLSGPEGCERMQLNVDYGEEDRPLKIELTDSETGAVVAGEELPQDRYGWYQDLTLTQAIEYGREYVLTVSWGDDTDTHRIRFVREEPFGAAGEPGYGATVYSEAVPARIDACLAKLSGVELGADADCANLLLAGDAPAGALLRDFAISNPSVDRAEAEAEARDMTAAANAAIREAYQYQIEGAAEAGLTPPVDAEALETCFGDEWRDVSGFDFALGFCRTQDGSEYTWLPVCYRGEDGGLQGDGAYLFVYIVRPGADEDTLGDAFYPARGDARTERLLISDPAAVAEILNLMRAETDVFAAGDDGAEYAPLAQGSRGSGVRALQQALVEHGYMTSSVDGYYGPMTAQAVSDCQEAMGLKATGEADAELQRALLSQEDDRALLLNWLEARG